MKNNQKITFNTFCCCFQTFSPLYSDEGVMWSSRKGNVRPNDVPECGFTGTGV